MGLKINTQQKMNQAITLEGQRSQEKTTLQIENPIISKIPLSLQEEATLATFETNQHLLVHNQKTMHFKKKETIKISGRQLTIKMQQYFCNN